MKNNRGTKRPHAPEEEKGVPHYQVVIVLKDETIIETGKEYCGMGSAGENAMVWHRHIFEKVLGKNYQVPDGYEQGGYEFLLVFGPDSCCSME